MTQSRRDGDSTFVHRWDSYNCSPTRVPRWAISGEEYDQANLDHGFDLLTDREYEVLELVMWGISSLPIAAWLGISTKTVEAHRGRIMDKTRAGDVPHLIRLWRAWNQD